MKNIIWKKHYFSSLYQQKINEITFTNISKENKLIILNNLWNYPFSEVIENTHTNLKIKIKNIEGDYKFHIKNAIIELILMIKKIQSKLNLNDNLKKYINTLN